MMEDTEYTEMQAEIRELWRNVYAAQIRAPRRDHCHNNTPEEAADQAVATYKETFNIK